MPESAALRVVYLSASIANFMPLFELDITEEKMDGVIGFEPMDDRIKICWLTTCRHPNKVKLRILKLRILGSEINDF